jgi:hypothetical protein
MMDFQFCCGACMHGGLIWRSGGKKKKINFFNFVEKDSKSIFYKAHLDEVNFSKKFYYYYYFKRHEKQIRSMLAHFVFVLSLVFCLM